METYTLAVIGGGPAGYIAAIKGAQLGASVILFEKDTLGGTCLNRGCIPAKTYIKGAEMIRHIKAAKQYGIVNDASFQIDLKQAVSNKNRVVNRLTGGVAALLKSNNIKVVYGEASLETEDTILCGGVEYRAEKIILCGGSKTIRIPVEGMEHKNVMTSDEILDLQELPGRLSIIGGGVIGCEIATVFRSYGCEVVIIEAAGRILPQMDEEISKGMEDAFRKKGIEVLTGKLVEKVVHTEKESTIYCKGGKQIKTDKILLSIGRGTDLSCLGKMKERIKTSNGKIVVDEYMHTNIANIFAAGDLNGKSMLAHAAFKMGETAAKNALGAQVRCDLRQVPGCVYTLPEAAGIGMTEQEAAELNGRENILTGKFPFAANGRALASGEDTGFVKVITDKRYKEILGVQIFGGLATEMIAEAAAFMHGEIPADEAAEMIHAHPSYSEAIMEACADACGMCMHLPGKKQK